MGAALSQADIGDLRIIQRIELSAGKGIIEAGGRVFHVSYDDLLDVVQAIEAIMLKLTWKLLNRKFVPKLRDRSAVKLGRLAAGGGDLYDNLTGQIPAGVGGCFYMVVEIGEERWDQWFTRLDELIKCLYNIVRETQEATGTVQ